MGAPGGVIHDPRSESLSMSLYYRHSGRFSPLSVLLAFGAGALAAVLLGFVYAYVVLYMPLAGFITFVLSALFGGAVGWVVGKAARWGRIRNIRVVQLTALAALSVGFYVSWGVWVYALLVRSEAEGVTLAACLNPVVLGKLVKAINESGAWTISGIEPTGIFLALLWLMEAAIIFGVAFFAVELSDPYCEKCQQWCRTGPIARIEPMQVEELRGVLEGRQLERLRLSQADEREERMELDLSTCLKCNQMHTLSARHLTVKVSDGKREMETTRVLDFLLLTSEEALALQNLHLLSARGEEHPSQLAGVVGGDGVDA